MPSETLLPEFGFKKGIKVYIKPDEINKEDMKTQLILKYVERVMKVKKLLANQDKLVKHDHLKPTFSVIYDIEIPPPTEQ